MNAQYYAELFTILKKRFDETKPAPGDKHAPEIELIRYHLLTGSTKTRALAERMAEQESAIAELEGAKP